MLSLSLKNNTNYFPESKHLETNHFETKEDTVLKKANKNL